MRNTFEYIADNYVHARSEPFGNHPIAGFVRHEAVETVKTALERNPLTLYRFDIRRWRNS